MYNSLHLCICAFAFAFLCICAEKDLQLGSDKCSYMVVSKMKPKSVHKSELFVDTCKLERFEDDAMVEEFEVKVSIKQEDLFVYLVHVILKAGNNMINIIHQKN